MDKEQAIEYLDSVSEPTKYFVMVMASVPTNEKLSLMAALAEMASKELDIEIHIQIHDDGQVISKQKHPESWSKH